MSSGDDAAGSGLSSGQTAAVGASSAQERPATPTRIPAASPAGTPDTGSAHHEPPAPFLPGVEREHIVSRWKEIQASFVDDPAAAVGEADALVGELIQQLADVLARERAGLPHRWAGDDRGSTEELRQDLHRYRAFFERLLATSLPAAGRWAPGMNPTQRPATAASASGNHVGGDQRMAGADDELS